MEEYGNKGFAIAYNSLVCLEDGMYIISYGDHSSAHLLFKINGNYGKLLHNGGGNGYVSTTFRLRRGDLLSFEGGWSHSSSESYLNNLNIYKA